MTDDALERRFPRRLLLGGGAVAAALAAAEAITPAPAAAAPTTNPWTLGGNNVSTDGTNFIGVKNQAPIIFKTPKTDGSALVERMRLTPVGDLGLGTAAPMARLDVVGTGRVAVQGRSTAPGASGVRGVADGGYGVWGVSGSIGCFGNGATYGMLGVGPLGVRGAGSETFGVNGDGPQAGVYGTSTRFPLWGDGGSISVYGTGGGNSGVKGVSPYVGVWGDGGVYGVYGRGSSPTGETYGVFGSAAGPSGYGLVSNGNARVFGTLSKNAGSFQIDHPLDPENRWLSHSFVESPDMMNVYNGNVVLGADGTATVALPAYFTALNRDFRYQLTCIGGFAPVYVAATVKDNRFGIAGGTPGMTVSWQVTGIRHDDYAKAHPIVVEQDKTAAERGSRVFRPQGSTAKAWPPEPGPRASTPPTRPADPPVTTPR